MDFQMLTSIVDPNLMFMVVSYLKTIEIDKLFRSFVILLTRLTKYDLLTAACAKVCGLKFADKWKKNNEIFIDGDGTCYPIKALDLFLEVLVFIDEENQNIIKGLIYKQCFKEDEILMFGKRLPTILHRCSKIVDFETIQRITLAKKMEISTKILQHIVQNSYLYYVNENFTECLILYIQSQLPRYYFLEVDSGSLVRSDGLRVIVINHCGASYNSDSNFRLHFCCDWRDRRTRDIERRGDDTTYLVKDMPSP